MPDSTLTLELGGQAVFAPKEARNTTSPAVPIRVGFVSLGCPKNLVDSEVMMGMLHQAGAELTARAEDADVIVVNTCSFIASAQQESVDTILEMVRHKTEGRAQKIVVAGCLVERFRSEIQKNIPEVDAVVGTGELENILAAAGIGTPAGLSGSQAGPFHCTPPMAPGQTRSPPLVVSMAIQGLSVFWRVVTGTS